MQDGIMGMLSQLLGGGQPNPRPRQENQGMLGETGGAQGMDLNDPAQRRNVRVMLLRQKLSSTPHGAPWADLVQQELDAGETEAVDESLDNWGIPPMFPDQTSSPDSGYAPKAGPAPPQGFAPQPGYAPGGARRGAAPPPGQNQNPMMWGA